MSDLFLATNDWNPTVVQRKTSNHKGHIVARFATVGGGPTGSSESSISVKGGGLGRITGVVFSAPAHSETVIDITINTTAVTPEDAVTVSKLVQGFLDLSKQHMYQENSSQNASASWSFFGGASASASASHTKSEMDSYGLSEANQATIIGKMFELLPKPSIYHFKSTIKNDTDFAVNGQMYLYSFTGVISMGNETKEMKFIGGPVAKGDDGSTLPITNESF